MIRASTAPACCARVLPASEARCSLHRASDNGVSLELPALKGVPEYVTVLDLHFTEAASSFERADDSITHRGKEPLFFVGRNPTIAFGLALGLDLDAKSVEGRRREDRRRAATTPIDRVSQDGKRSVEAASM